MKLEVHITGIFEALYALLAYSKPCIVVIFLLEASKTPPLSKCETPKYVLWTYIEVTYYYEYVIYFVIIIYIKLLLILKAK